MQNSKYATRVAYLLQGRFVGSPNGNRQRLHCPFVHNHKNGDANPSASLNLETGWLDCAVCGAFSPKAILRFLGDEDGWQVEAASHARPPKPKSESPPKPDFEQLWSSLVPLEIKWRGLLPSVLKIYDVRIGLGKHVPDAAMAFPYYDGSRIIGIKYRLPLGEQRYSAIAGSTFDVPFGVHVMVEDGGMGDLIVCEGEINAMSLYQAVGDWFEVVSIGSQRPSKALIERLKKFVQTKMYRRIVFWLDEAERADDLIPLFSSDCEVYTIISQISKDGRKLDANEILASTSSFELARVFMNQGIIATKEQWHQRWLDYLDERAKQITHATTLP